MSETFETFYCQWSMSELECGAGTRVRFEITNQVTARRSPRSLSALGTCDPATSLHRIGVFAIVMSSSLFSPLTFASWWLRLVYVLSFDKYSSPWPPTLALLASLASPPYNPHPSLQLLPSRNGHLHLPASGLLAAACTANSHGGVLCT